MNKNVRSVIVLIATLGLILLAGNHVAWASLSERPMDPTVVPQGTPRGWNKKGSVRPPHCEGLTITVSGEYSVCGMAILSVEFKTSEDVKLLASIDPVIPKGNPGKVLAGSVAIG
jgi:hypothetical protein